MAELTGILNKYIGAGVGAHFIENYASYRDACLEGKEITGENLGAIMLRVRTKLELKLISLTQACC